MTLSLTNQGFDYVSYYNGAYEDADSLDAVDATGANSIEASLEYGIDPQTDTIYADSSFTDSLSALSATIRQAVGLGLSVMVRPLIDFVNPGDLTGTPYSVGEWRTYFNPGAAGSVGANAFFVSYQTMILQEAQVAVANGATSLCVGTEIDQITGPAYKSYWDSIIAALRADDPTLKLTYAADWDDDLSPWQWGGTGLTAGTGNLATQVSFASELDSIGVDCYAPISDAANPTLTQLIAGWTQTPTDATSLAVTGGQSLIAYFESVAAAVGKPLVFTEIGYENVTDAASQPAGSSTNVVDSSLQAKLYEAFFEAWQQAGNSSLTGVYFWNWDPNAAEVGPGQGVNFSPQGLPAQSVAADWFGSGPMLAITSAGGLTSQTAQTISGVINVADAGLTVSIYDGTTLLGTATPAANGDWSASVALLSTQGAQTITAQATDGDSKIGTSGTITYTFVGPTVAVAELQTYATLIDASSGFQVAVVDTTANVQANLAALQGDASHIASITATGGQVTVGNGLFVADQVALNKIVGGFTILGQAPVLQGNLNGLEADIGHINSITGLNGTITASVATFEVDQAALNEVVGGFAISDTAANVQAGLAALQGDASPITSITATGGVVSVGVGKFIPDQAALDKIAGGFAIFGQSPVISANFDALAADVSHIQSVAFADASPVLRLSQAQTVADAGLLAKVSGAYVLDVANPNGSTTTTGHGDGLTIQAVATGADTITGGGSNESFVLPPNFGNNAITDFYQHLSGAGADAITLPSSDFQSFAAMLGDAVTVGADTVIPATSGDALTLLNLTTSTLATARADFNFM